VAAEIAVTEPDAGADAGTPPALAVLARAGLVVRLSEVAGVLGTGADEAAEVLAELADGGWVELWPENPHGASVVLTARAGRGPRPGPPSEGRAEIGLMTSP
jgi:hypothetical protein